MHTITTPSVTLAHNPKPTVHYGHAEHLPHVAQTVATATAPQAQWIHDTAMGVPMGVGMAVGMGLSHALARAWGAFQQWGISMAKAYANPK
jgi:uncharacterized protein (UPF0548 family)